MNFLKDLLLFETSYQPTLAEKYFVYKDSEHTFVVEHVMFHPAAVDTYFHRKREKQGLFEFELEFDATVRVYDEANTHIISAVVEGEVGGLVEEATGKIAFPERPHFNGVKRYKRLSHSAPREPDIDLRYNVADALMSNQQYFKTMLVRYVTGSEGNWRDFIQSQIEEIHSDEKAEEEWDDDE